MTNNSDNNFAMINLDDLDVTELKAFAREARYTPMSVAGRLFKRHWAFNVDALHGYVVTVLDLGHYAMLTAQARSSRLDGDIQMALALEKAAEGVYSRLPAYARF